jgi:CDP-2,3-bis-(O-geranylgeranyl)-sn-glycerol synthase
MRDAALHLLQLLYFMLPAYAANMAPPFVRFWRGWNWPIHARLLGAHKTVVGFAVGVSAGVLVTAMQATVATPLARVDYGHWPLLGLGLGGGAMLGDSIKSLFKRQLGIAPGSRWFPFDQLDFVLGALAFVGCWAGLSWSDVGVLLVVSLIGDVLVNRLAFALRIKDAPW